MRAQVVLLEGDRILLACHQRGNRHYWVLPGGAVEESESPEEAAVREVREEAGLEIRLERLLFVDGPRSDSVVTIRQPRYTYLGAVIGGSLQPVADPAGGNEANGHLDRVAWMPFDAPDFDPATRDTLDLVLRSLGVDQAPSGE